MRPDPGARGGGRKGGAPCTRVGSPPLRGEATGALWVWPWASADLGPTHNTWTEAALQSHAPHSEVGFGLMWPLLRGSPLMHPGSPGKS